MTQCEGHNVNDTYGLLTGTVPSMHAETHAETLAALFPHIVREDQLSISDAQEACIASCSTLYMSFLDSFCWN